jgi:hypothetical protein
MSKESEGFKGSIHAIAASLAATFLAYNAMKAAETRDTRNIVNVLVYLPMTVFEWANVKHHWGKVFADAPMRGVPRMTRRELLVTLGALVVTQKAVTAAPVGFHVTGVLSALESEKLEGYAQIGTEFGLSAHPKGAAYKPLMDLVGQTVRVSVVPE